MSSPLRERLRAGALRLSFSSAYSSLLRSVREPRPNGRGARLPSGLLSGGYVCCCCCSQHIYRGGNNNKNNNSGCRTGPLVLTVHLKHGPVGTLGRQVAVVRTGGSVELGS